MDDMEEAISKAIRGCMYEFAKDRYDETGYHPYLDMMAEIEDDILHTTRMIWAMQDCRRSIERALEAMCTKVQIHVEGEA